MLKYKFGIRYPLYILNRNKVKLKLSVFIFIDQYNLDLNIELVDFSYNSVFW